MWLIAMVSVILVLAAPARADDPLVLPPSTAQITLGESARFRYNLGDSHPIHYAGGSGLHSRLLAAPAKSKSSWDNAASSSLVVRVTPQMAG